MRLAIIPARGASVRVPRKNVRDFHGRPMLSYPIETAKASGLFDMIVVSTDDAEIAAVAFACGAVVVPREADDGSTGTQEVAARVLDQLHVYIGAACVIYPCSPLMLPSHLQEGHRTLLLPANLNRRFAMSVGPDGADAGCVYWGWTLAFRDRAPLDAHNTVTFALPAERVCDVNTIDDWTRAEQMFTALRGANRG